MRVSGFALCRGVGVVDRERSDDSDAFIPVFDTCRGVHVGKASTSCCLSGVLARVRVAREDDFGFISGGRPTYNLFARLEEELGSGNMLNR